MNWNLTFGLGFPAFLLLLWWATCRDRRRKRAAAFAPLDRLRAGRGWPAANVTSRHERLSRWGLLPAALMMPAFLLWEDYPHLFPAPLHAAVVATGWDLDEQIMVVGMLLWVLICGWQTWTVCRRRFAVAAFGAPRAVKIARDDGFTPFPDPVLTAGTVGPENGAAMLLAAAFAAWLGVAAANGFAGPIAFYGVILLGWVPVAAAKAWALPGNGAAFLTERGVVSHRREVAWEDADRVLFAPAPTDEPSRKRLPNHARGGAGLEVERDGLSERFLLTPSAAAVADDLLAAVPPDRLARLPAVAPAGGGLCESPAPAEPPP